MTEWVHEVVIVIAPTLAVIASTVFSQIKRKRAFRELHITLNSRLTELLKASRFQAFAEGELKGGLDARTEANGKGKKPLPE